MMSSKMLVHAKAGSFADKVDRVFTRLAHAYRRLLEVALRFRLLMVGFLVVVLVVLYILFKMTPSALLPQENQGVILGVGEGPTYSNLQYTNKYLKEMADIFNKVPEREHYGQVVGFTGMVNSMVAFLVLRPPQPGDRTESQIINWLRPRLDKIPGIIAFPMNRPPLVDVSGFSAPVNFVVQTTGSYTQLFNVMQELKADVEKNPKLINVQQNLKINKPAFNITINRLRAAQLGVSVRKIAETLNILLGKPIVSWFSSDSWSYPVVPQLLHQFRTHPAELNKVYVRSVSGKLIPLSNLITYQKLVEPQSLNQFQQLRSATLTANLAHGYTLGEALHFIEGKAKQLMTKDMQYTFSGESRIFKQESGEMLYLFLGALLAVYLLMVVKFLSFTDPFIVLISVPLSMIGAFIAMWLIGANLNIYTQIGLLMLIGLISKQGILIVDFANHIQREKGVGIREAVVEASMIRLRPILMTTVAMVFGAIPLVFAQGAGHVALHQIGSVIVGGLTVGSIFSLFVVPTIYTFIGHRLKKQ
jgi:multidrug efflux pump